MRGAGSADAQEPTPHPLITPAEASAPAARERASIAPARHRNALAIVAEGLELGLRRSEIESPLIHRHCRE